MTKKYKDSDVTQEELQKRAIVTFRKHLSWYFKTNKIGTEIPGIKEFRGELVRINSIEELREILDRFLASQK